MVMPNREEIFDLSFRLRGERLVTEAEITLLQELNKTVNDLRGSLHTLTWICRHQQLDLNRLAVYSDPDFPPSSACARACQLSQVVALESYRRLGGGHNVYVADLIQLLVDKPKVVAQLLLYGENFEGKTMQDLVQVAYVSLYGSCLMQNDERAVLEVLNYLIGLQIMTDTNPRRLLRRGRCAFSRLYKLFSEGLHSAKRFLTAALHDAIMFVLSQDEIFLDIDPGKSAIRFPPAERLRRFGEEGTPVYQENLKKFRQIMVAKLVAITNKFIQGIGLGLHCFPPCLSWLVRQLYDRLLESGAVSEEEATMISTDLVFTLFICPAITNPEPFGIIGDVPISNMARFNLMQVGQILQVLAVIKYEQVDKKLMDLYSQFDPNSMASVNAAILNQEIKTMDELYVDVPTDSPLNRDVVLIQTTELNGLLTFLKSVQGQKWISDDEAASELLDNVLQKLPNSFADSPKGKSNTIAGTVGPKTPNGTTAKKAGASGTLPSSSSALKFLSPSSDSITANLLRSSPSNDDIHNGTATADEGPLEVLIIPLRDAAKPLGFDSEDVVLARFRNVKRDVVKFPTYRDADGNEIHKEPNEKRTRFSLSNDLESIGTSDNLENESVSNQSVCSSESNPEVNSIMADNLSDVYAMSANVSGRGTPSNSGRDTPLSSHQGAPPDEDVEIDEVDDVPSTPGGIPQGDRPLPSLPETAQKENRADIQERFGKFEIPHPSHSRSRDETRSLMSDCWSTDVMASDSEYGAAERGDGLPDLIPDAPPDMARLDLIREEANLLGGHGGESLEDRSETWSVDVLASDSEADKADDQDMDELNSQPDAGDGSNSIVMGPRHHHPHHHHRHHHHHHHRLPHGASLFKGLGFQDHPPARGTHSSPNLQAVAAMGGKQKGPLPFANQDGLPPAGAHGATGGVSTPNAGVATSSVVSTPGVGPSGVPPEINFLPASVDSGASTTVAPRILRRQSSGSAASFTSSRRSEADMGSELGDSLSSQHLLMVDNLPSASSTAGQAGKVGGAVAAGGGDKGSKDGNQGPPKKKPNGTNDDGRHMPDPSIGSIGSSNKASAAANGGPMAAGKQASSMEVSSGQCSSSSSDLMMECSLSEPAHTDGIKSLTEAVMINVSPSSDADISMFQQQQRTPTQNSNGHNAAEDGSWNECNGGEFGAGMDAEIGGGKQTASNTSSHSTTDDDDDHPLSRQTLGRLSFVLGANEPLPGLSSDTTEKIRSNPFDGKAAEDNNASQKQNNESSSSAQAKGSLSQIKTPLGPGAGKGAILRGNRKAEDGARDKDSTPSDRRRQKILNSVKSVKTTFTHNLKAVKRSQTENQISDLTRNLSTGMTLSNSENELNIKPVSTNGATDGQLGIPGESSDDILEKYRSPKPAISIGNGVSSAQQDLINLKPLDGASGSVSIHAVAVVPSIPTRPYLDTTNITTCQAFIDAKRKLRTVLSSVDVQCLPTTNSEGLTFSNPVVSKTSKDKELMQFLKFLLAEALNSQDKPLTAQLRETIRCVEAFDSKGVRKLLRALREEHRRRSSYITYLQQSKMTLLQCKAFLDQLISRIDREEVLCGECLVEVCGRLFLEQHEKDLKCFLIDFSRLSLQDEKTDLVDRFLAKLYAGMGNDPLWQNANDEQIERAQLCMQRSLMSQIYIQALYPNGDADASRDEVLHEHMKRLSDIITPDHKDLRIPVEYHAECPWTSAQAEIAIINAYKTPRDKLHCVVRCCETLVHLLKMAGSAAAADDLMPVLVFVLIKANPPALLSTIQYVNGFYGSHIEGECAYWWTQFSSAVEFIKMMTY